jgi:hypothetical protein
MKNLFSLIRLSISFLVAIQLNQAGNCQTLLNENFNYASGTTLTTNGWTAHSSSGVNPVTISSQGLVFEGYPSSDIGLAAMLLNTGEDVNKAFTTATSGTLFCAFLVKANSCENNYFLHLAGSPVGNNYKGRIFTNSTGTTFNFGLSKGSETPVYTTGLQYSIGSVYLLVLKYLINEGSSNDEVSLYIITGSVPSSEPSIPEIGPLTDPGQSDLTNVSSVALRQYSATQNILVDGIRVATSWENVIGFTTGNEDLLDKNIPVIYPVPVSAELFINDVSYAYKIEIFDFSGRLIVSEITGGKTIVRIPVNNLPGGLYLLRIYSHKGYKTIKFIKS